MSAVESLKVSASGFTVCGDRGEELRRRRHLRARHAFRSKVAWGRGAGKAFGRSEGPRPRGGLIGAFVLKIV